MKTKILALGIVLSVLAIGCNRDDDNNAVSVPMTQSDVKANSEMDNISDDVLQITESQSNESISGRGAEPGFLGPCGGNITTTVEGNTWIRTIDFGATNCILWNGNRVRGKIILTFTNDFANDTRTIAYAFDNFYHNDRHVEGNRTVVKRILENGHPQATISLALTVTVPNGTVLTRNGERIREFTDGYDTWLNLSDNVFAYTGSWTTSNSTTGITHTATVNSPVIVKWNCLHWIVSGTVTYNRSSDNATAILDYGDGACDDEATVTINGIVFPFTF
ncbi:hypothetical protein [Flavobacterium sp.]|uniref:hypothetical protein n=1 Tax=Flavobacterium sp. TaxID=239 RepID=UPI0039E69D73